MNAPTPIHTLLPKSSLFFSDGSSDKEYHAEITEKDGGFVVNFRYGRRGAALTCGTKTPTPVEYAAAEKVYLKLVKEKTSKGYTPDESGTSYTGTEDAGRKSDFQPQLLNAINETEALRLLDDPDWYCQEKMDGERRAVHASQSEEKAVGMNRKGLLVPLPEPIALEMERLAMSDGDIRNDAEIIGDNLYVFDLHIYRGKDISRSVEWEERMALASQMFKNCAHIKAVPVAKTSAEKHALWNKVKAAKGEGIVFKRVGSLYKPGKPNSGGDWLKFKFTESATVVVTGSNPGKRSVAVSLYEDGKLVSVGNVTIPANYQIPEGGELAEVEYLYAFKGGSLFQPVYRGKRNDIEVEDCTTAQLKYKPEGRDEDE